MSALHLASAAVNGMVMVRAGAPTMQAEAALKKNEWNPMGIDVPGAVPE